MAKLQNCTALTRTLKARNKAGFVVSVRFGPDEIREVPDEILALFRANPATRRWLEMGLIKELKPPKIEKPKKKEIVDKLDF